ncbi:MAG: sugar nucleotide-binding protein [Betaproteobacteria bacterium]|nr:sugar nucleotide-binding protein [Betaproteobacteria bacterium]
MKILIIGARGFIGRHIEQACQAQGFQVVRGVRNASTSEIDCDLVRDTDKTVWLPRLIGIDGVINCVGLLHAEADTLQAVHCDAPAAIAAACASAKVPFVHISVLGLAHAPDTPYFRSKQLGDEAIRAVNSAAILVRPSLVFGTDSPSSQLLLLQARLPVFFLPADTRPVAPIHVDDLAALCLCLIGTLRAYGCDVDGVGEVEMSIADYMQKLRAFGHHDEARVVPVPNQWMRFALSATALCGAKTLRPEALDLMEHQHTGKAHTFARWMHRPPRPVERFQAA